MQEKFFYSEHFYERGSKDTEVLEKNADEYPLSSLAAFLLLYHYKKTGHQDFEKLARKTVLKFSNPQWLQYQLLHDTFKGQEMAEVTVDEKEEVLPEISAELPAEVSYAQHFMEDVVTEHGEPEVFENIETEKSLGADAEVPPKIEDERGTEDEPDAQNERIAEVLEALPVPSSHEENETADSSEIDEEVAFEPLHTIDYFASQGIRITDELISNDKLGSQMKSFTEWLKSMKKLHPSKLEEQSLATERLIRSAADESNINSEILTEAMAEVLIKQDKKEKAIEMFSKLSLINPAKSAYFAARIESIKSS